MRQWIPLQSGVLFYCLNYINLIRTFEILPLRRTQSIHTLGLMKKFNGLINNLTPNNQPELNKVEFIDTEITWNLLDNYLRQFETTDERTEFENKKQGRGGSNHKSNVRLFNSPFGHNLEIVLYRDAAAWCPYCEKVWLQLEEKRIPYRIEKIPLRCYGEKPRSFLQINPSGGLPAAIIKGKTMSESNDIMYEIEKMFPNDNPLLPDRRTPKYSRVDTLLKLERKAFSIWFRWLTSSDSSSGMMSKAMDSVLREVDYELSVDPTGPYFLGDFFSLVDIMFTPFLERMSASLPYYKGFEVRSDKYPTLLQWFNAMDSRPAYQGIKSDYYTHCHDLPPQIGDCVFEAGSTKYREAIDGGDWTLAKGPLECFEPMIPMDAGIASRESARSLIDNYAAVVKFSTRGASSVRNGASVGAPLADPNLQPNMDLVPLVDSSLRFIVYQMLLPSSPTGSNPSQINPPQFISPGKTKGLIRNCLLYLRDRVGVPRDMSVHAARLLRSHCNDFITRHLDS